MKAIPTGLPGVMCQVWGSPVEVVSHHGWSLADRESLLRDGEEDSAGWLEMEIAGGDYGVEAPEGEGRRLTAGCGTRRSADVHCR